MRVPGVALVLLSLASSVTGGQAPPQPPPAPPGTDIHLVPMSGGLTGLASAKPTPMAVARGYDNQPFFDPDNRRVLYTANRDDKQTDIYEFDRTTATTRQLTRTPEGEYSPTIPAVRPAGAALARDGFTVIRVEPDGTQRLWQFDRAGASPALVLTEIKPVGYHAWVDADRLALFVLGKPSTLQLARVGTGKAEVAAKDIGRSLHTVPGTRRVSFVQRETSGEYWVKAIDIDSGRIEPIVKAVDGSDERDTAWMPDGVTVLMSSGTRVFASTKGEPWQPVLDVASHGLGAVTRLAVSPKGDALAIVVAEPKR